MKLTANNPLAPKSLLRFLGLVIVFSSPLFLAANYLDATKIIPVALPLSALAFLCVLIAAVIVTAQDGGSVPGLLQRGLDFARIRRPGWRVGVFLLMPLVVLLSYGLELLAGVKVSQEMTPLLGLPVFLLVYGFSGYCEQIGWTAILTDGLLARFGVVRAGFMVGLVWAAWHIIPFIQTHHAIGWVIWQCLFTIIYRVLLTKVYVLTGKSVFSTIAMHATYNTAFSLMPYYGSSYNSMYMAFATLLTTLLVFGVDAVAQRRLQRG